MDSDQMAAVREMLMQLDAFQPARPNEIDRVEVASLARSLFLVLEDQQRQIDQLRGRFDREELERNEPTQQVSVEP
jgi:hypothetical protein